VLLAAELRHAIVVDADLLEDALNLIQDWSLQGREIRLIVSYPAGHSNAFGVQVIQQRQSAAILHLEVSVMLVLRL